MCNLSYYHKAKKPYIVSSIGHKVKSAWEIGSTAKGLFDMGRGKYQGVATYGPMAVSALRIIGPMVATAGL